MDDWLFKLGLIFAVLLLFILLVRKMFETYRFFKERKDFCDAESTANTAERTPEEQTPEKIIWRATVEDFDDTQKSTR